jgi:hypothetical protein
MLTLVIAVATGPSLLFPVVAQAVHVTSDVTSSC